MISRDALPGLAGRVVYDSNGTKIGNVDAVYLDQDTDQPEWIAVRTRRRGHRESLAPLAAASLTDDGDVRLGWAKDDVTSAPEVHTAQDTISADDETRLYAHYRTRRPGPGEQGPPTGTEPVSAPATTATGNLIRKMARGADPDAAREDSGAGGSDDAMTRSEERLRVTTRREPTTRARLRKYLVTDEVQVTVPVSREEVRVEHERVWAGEGDRPAADPEDATGTDMVLRAEEPVVTKKTVPVERVRLGTEQVTHTEVVSEPVRRERIRAEGDVDESGA
jgi:uncharacterized protein (TIGR02271 family)